MQPECTYTYRRKHFTMMKTLSRSSGAVQVRDMAPATPPANRWRHHIPDFISTSVKSSGTSESSPMSKRWSKPETGFHDRSSHGFATATAHFKLYVLHAPYIINCFEIAHYYPVTGHVSHIAIQSKRNNNMVIKPMYSLIYFTTTSAVHASTDISITWLHDCRVLLIDKLKNWKR